MVTHLQTTADRAIEPTASRQVTLIDGSPIDLCKLSLAELMDLHWEQEPAFAKQIAESRKGSVEREQVIAWAYETVCSILYEIDLRDPNSSSFAMGMDVRYVDLVLRTLQSQRQRGLAGGFFELGFGSGILLQAVSRAGFAIGGLEVAESLFAEAKTQLALHDTSRLVYGNFLQLDLEQHAGQYSVVYWNDVFEHIQSTRSVITWLSFIVCCNRAAS